jgi:hypothetical protein
VEDTGVKTGCDKSEEPTLVHNLEHDLVHEATPEAQRQANMDGEGFLANILQSRSTNSRAYNVAIHNDGSATAQIGGERLAFPPGTIDTAMLRRLLNAIGDVSKIPTETRMKSASFGTRTQIEYGAKTSGDLQSLPKRTSETDSVQMRAFQELREFVQAVLSQLKIGARVVVAASAIGG